MQSESCEYVKKHHPEHGENLIEKRIVRPVHRS